MYTVLSGIGRLKAAGSRWIEEDFGIKLVLGVVSQYDQVFLKVQSDDWPGEPRVVTLTTLMNHITDYSTTVQGVFDRLGNTTIANTPGRIVIEEYFVKAADAVQAGYKMKRVLLNQHPDTPVTPYEGDAAALTKTGVDPREFHKYCLTTVNGLIHLDDADDNTIFVLDAQKTSMHSRRNEIGIINFKDIGELEKRRITADMVHRRDPNQPLMNQLYIQMPGAPIGKTAMLVMGGYLHLLDEVTFRRVADDIFCVDMQACLMIDRYLESRQIINFEGIFEMELYGANNAQFITEQLLSDENLIRYMTMSQSFLVFVDSDAIRVDRERLETGRSYGQYIAHGQGKPPKSPMVLGFGVMPSYWVREDDTKWSLTVADNLRNNLLIHTVDSVRGYVPNPADNRIPYDKEEISAVNLWHISSERVVLIQPARP